MAGRASPAFVLARAACISSRRSLAIRMTSARPRGDGSLTTCAAAAPGDVTTTTAISTSGKEKRFMSFTTSNRIGPAYAGPTPAPLPTDSGELLVHLGRRRRLLRLVP